MLGDPLSATRTPRKRRTRCCGGWPPGTACSCGWRRLTGRSSAPAGSSRPPGPSSPESGAGPHGRSGGPGDLPGPHRGPGTFSARAGQTADAQRLDRVLSAHPGAGGAGQGLCYDALHVAPVRISGRPGVVSAETSHAIAWGSGLAAAMAFPQSVAVGCRPAGQASTMACLPLQPGRQDAEQTRSQLDRRLDGQTVGRVGVLPSTGSGCHQPPGRRPPRRNRRGVPAG